MVTISRSQPTYIERPRNTSVVKSSPIKATRCFIEQDILPTLLRIVRLQQGIQAFFI